MADNDFYILGDQTSSFKDSSSQPAISEDVLSILKNALSRNASDIHFQVGSQPIFRTDGILSPFTGAKPITSAFMANCADIFLSKDQKEYLFENRQVDCSVT
ncbi:MAG: hypothetical protein HY767_02925, partial [Candidatus Omnitrophica bacterium]|nr:hypothetical protein [Candidatus Omnitrophota bacterium]